MQWNLPNTLTVLRLLAAPALVLVYEIFPHPVSDWLGLGLFLAAALTDYFDGLLARRWKQVSAFGRMLDPIADKAMTILALVMLALLLGSQTLFVLPAMAIIFREVFISGLREFLGARSANLAVTRLAKWKTAVQMVAVAVLFGHLIAEHYFVMQSFAMERSDVDAVLNGQQQDIYGLRFKYLTYFYSYYSGIALMWLAALLTVVTGFDYFRKALPFLQDEPAK